LSPLDVVEEIVLLSLLGALAFSYVLDRVQIHRYRRHARSVIVDLQSLEMHLRNDGAAGADHGTMRERLLALERRLTAASKRLISWRSSPIEHWIIGSHIDPLLFEYERAGAMTTRLLALISRQSASS